MQVAAAGRLTGFVVKPREAPCSAADTRRLIYDCSRGGVANPASVGGGGGGATSGEYGETEGEV